MASELQVNTITEATAGSGITFSKDIIPATPLSHRNMMINGAMLVDQRRAGVASTNIGATAGFYCIDRWKSHCSGTSARYTISQQPTTDLAGFPMVQKIACTTASASPGAAEQLSLRYTFEGQDLQGLEKGFSTAKSFTISFWVKGTASRTYVLELKDSDNSRHITQQFSTTASWVRQEITFPGDTAGKITNDNTEGLELNIWLLAGANLSGGTYTASTWKTTTTNQRAAGVSDSGAGGMKTTSDTFEITGIQMELGNKATPFEHRSFADELRRCQRYYYAHTDGGTDKIIGKGGFNAAAQFEATVHFKETMRAAPTLKISTGGNYYQLNVSGGAMAFDDFAMHAANAVDFGGCNATSLYKGSFSGTVGHSGNLVTNNANAYVHFDAEL